jgi:YggT family protein
MLFDTIGAVANFVYVFAFVYVLVLVLYILTTWIQLPYSLRPVQRFLSDVCDPYLRLWRRLLPLSLGPLDLSATVGIIVLLVAARIVVAILDQF